MPRFELTSRFCRRYRVAYPIVQAGMAFVSLTEALPVAVSQAGGIGSIANVGFFPPAILQSVWAAARRRTDRPLSVNLITCFVQPEIIEALVEIAPLSVSFHWGRPDPAWVQRLQAAGIEVWEQVGSVAQARRAVDDGIDVIIVQGSEAGGHNYGESSLGTLLPAVRDAVGPEPLLLASGGIVDGRGLAAALMLGADGAWIGTRYAVSAESEAHPEWKRRMVQASGADTTLTHVFGRQQPGFNPVRVLRNQVVREWNDRVLEIPVDTSTLPVLGTMEIFGQKLPLHRFQYMAPVATTEVTSFEEMPLLCGEGVGGIRDIPSAAEITHRIAEEALARLDALATQGVVA